jgi:DNA sulfur modification protein DndD
MIIRKLRLENFGIYKGTHEINLCPDSREKPIVLFGGLNGGGKTTLLDAIQLALFGKLSRCSSRGTLAYEEFLRRCISSAAAPGSGGSVALEILQTFDAQVHNFVITRSWLPVGKGITETLIVQRDNVVDPDLAANWLEHVDQFVPVGLSELFFFDGEQIARLAEADNAAQMLATAINTLLGIDLVDRLEKDLVIYERDVAKTLQGSESMDEIATREAKLKTSQEELQKLTFDKGRLQTEVDQAQKKAETIEVSFRRQGGDVFTRRRQLSAERESIRVQAAKIEHDMREMAAGTAPLLLVESQLARIRVQAACEETAENQLLFLAELEKRDRTIAGLLKRGDFPDGARTRLEAIFLEDRQRRTRTTQVDRFLNLDRSGRQSLMRLEHRLFDDIRKRSAKLTKELDDLNRQALLIDETLARVPDEAAIAQISELFVAAQKELVAKQVELGVLSERITQMGRQIEEEEKMIGSLLEKNVDAAVSQDDASRKIKFALKVRSTMREFRMRVLERKIRQIEGLILDSFQQLLRKKDLVGAIRIDPASYRMSLIGANGQELHTDRLSAGERQLLAVSTLWGLARASGRPLPTIIDTPLGRLDSRHRANLVANYFPYASHQVIILSTDEEIGKNHLETLKPRISRTFELTYSREKQSAEVVSGYFF